MLLTRLCGALALLACIAATNPASAQALSQGDQAIYRSAFEKADLKDWSAARATAAQAGDPTLAEVILWLQLQDSSRTGDFVTIVSFLVENPGWPRLDDLRRRAEEAMPQELAPADVIAYFDAYPPLSGKGTLRQLAALEALGRTEELQLAAIDAWNGRDFSSSDEKTFLERYASIIPARLAWTRLDRLLWEGQTTAAERILPFVDADHRALARARIVLRNGGPGVDGAVNAVPLGLADDPGLLYERLRWRRTHGNEAGAIELLARAPAELGYPDLWAQERLILARDLLETGNAAGAYRILAQHFELSGAVYHEVEWLAGWISLRKLGNARNALDHFMTFYGEVSYPISRARGAYWAGRAAEALGDTGIATTWYDLAADNGTTFYGQLGAAKLGIQPRLPEAPQPTQAEIAAFAGDELTTIVRQLAEIGQERLVRVFLTRMTDATDSGARHQLIGQLALVLRRPDLAVMVAKRAVQAGSVLVTAGYPMIALPEPVPVDPSLAYAIIRQESGFDPGVVSPAGARGLMQLMPATAREVAGKLGLSSSDAKLTSDPLFNMRLGTTYLAQMIENQNGSFVRAIASYNAGPGRVRQWVEAMGDPHDPNVDIVDWIEEIPFSETRNYVQRVLEGMEVYRMLNGQETAGLFNDMKMNCTQATC